MYEPASSSIRRGGSTCGASPRRDDLEVDRRRRQLACLRPHADCESPFADCRPGSDSNAESRSQPAQPGPSSRSTWPSGLRAEATEQVAGAPPREWAPRAVAPERSPPPGAEPPARVPGSERERARERAAPRAPGKEEQPAAEGASVGSRRCRRPPDGCRGGRTARRARDRPRGRPRPPPHSRRYGRRASPTASRDV